MEFKGWVLKGQRIESELEFIPLDAISYIGYTKVPNRRRLPAIFFTMLFIGLGFGLMFYGPAGTARQAGAIALLFALTTLLFCFGSSRAFIIATHSGHTFTIRENVGDDDLRTFEIFVQMVFKKREAYIKGLNQSPPDPIEVD